MINFSGKLWIRCARHKNALLIDAAYAHACMSHFPVDEVCASLSIGMCPVAMFEHPSSPVDVVKLLTRLWAGGQPCELVTGLAVPPVTVTGNVCFVHNMDAITLMCITH